MRDKQLAFRKYHVGKTLPVLIETSRRAGRVHLAGWTDNYLRVDLGAGDTQSVMEDVHIHAIENGELLGTRVAVSA
jgi:tRNA A37 methylthiotransferase MiaB